MMGRTAGPRLLVIGLDGGTLDLLLPWMKSGQLPSLAAAARNGVLGTLRSTIPPFSAVAWASFATGKNPGKHGLFDFRAPRQVSPQRSFTDARSIKAKTLWRILSEHGKRVGVLNVPMTYPPEEVNGFLVGGILTFANLAECTYPQALYRTLVKEIGDYRLELDWGRYRELGSRGDGDGVLSSLLDDIRALTEQRAKAALYLMKTHPWDLFIAVFTELDRLQHFFWKYLDPSHPLHDAQRAAQYREPLLRYYQMVDGIIGEMIAQAGPDANLLICSDHGFGPVVKRFCINRWLSEMGFFKTKREAVTWRSWLKKFDRGPIRALIPASISQGVKARLAWTQCVDWARTQAYSGTPSEQGIFINLRGREPAGIVEPGREYERLCAEIINQLRELKDPDTGDNVVDQVFRRDELYWGPYTELAPDIVFMPKGMAYLVNEELDRPNLFEPSGFDCGAHRLEGMLLAAGRDIVQGATLEGAHLVDLAPTILHLLGLPIPAEMDGNVLQALFAPDSPAATSPGSTSEGGSPGPEYRGDASYSDQDREEIERRLRGLGYLS